MNKSKNVKMLTDGGMMIALGTLLGMIKIYQAANGGSVSAGSMIPIIVFSIIWGIGPGFAVGSVFGLLDFILKPYFYHPIQFLLDYILAYAFLGLAGLARKTGEDKRISLSGSIIGTILGISGRALSHVLSGVIFFAEYAGDQNPWTYSIVYNATYLIPELIISVIVLVLIWKPLSNFIIGREI